MGVTGTNIDSGKIVLHNLLYKVKKSDFCEGGEEINRKCGWNYPTYHFNRTNYGYLNDRISLFVTTQLSDGVVVGSLPFRYGDNNSQNNNNAIGWIFIDTNGLKQPNTNGRDVFLFHLTNQGIVPFGYKDELSDSWTFSFCRSSGYGCAAWVLKQKNMNYLHSDKCSWENTSCK